MKIYCFLLISLLYSSLLSALTLDYSVKHIINNDMAELEITMHFDSNDNGVTKIKLPDNWAGMQDVSGGLYTFSLDNPNIILENTNDHLCIYSPPNEILTLSYRVKNKTDHPFKPKIRDNFFWFISNTVFLVPEISFDEVIKIIIDWNGVSASNSYGSKVTRQIFNTTLNEFLDSLFMGGDVAQHDFSSAGNSFSINIYPKKNIANKKIIKLIEDIISNQYATMPGHAENYLISFTELNDSEFVGINLNNAFSIMVDEIEKYSLDKLLYTIVHEHFHTWLGKKITSTNDYEHQMWFTEGFNDFCSVLHAYESGLISFEKYLDIYNAKLKGYLTSPLKAIPYDVIAKRYWQDSLSLQLYPYHAGHVFAQEMNHLLKQKDPSNSLIQVFKKILTEHEENLPLIVNTADILDLLDEYAYPETSVLWEKYFKHGEIIQPSPDLFKDIAELEWKEAEAIDYGFNFRSAYQFNVIEISQEQSNALLAGLNNNQKIESINLELYPELISVKVNKDIEENIIIHSNEVKVMIPQYILKKI